MQKASFPGLMHRFLGKLKPDQHLRAVGTGKRRKEDYSFCEVCCGILYALMMGIFRPIHMMELKADKVFQRPAGLTRFPSQSTISRFLSRITVHKAEHVAEINFSQLNKIRRGFRDMKTITLDLDSHVIPVFGLPACCRQAAQGQKGLQSQEAWQVRLPSPYVLHRRDQGLSRRYAQVWQPYQCL